MRELIMWNLVTLYGYFEGRKSWDIDFHNSVWGDELERISIEQSKEVGTLVFGRVTYEGMAGYWPKEKGEVADFMNRVPKVVFSRTLRRADWNNTKVLNRSAEKEIAKLKGQRGKDLFIFGSANLAATFTRKGLIDEYRLCVAPVILGGGNPLFKESSERMNLELLEERPLKSGGVILRYRGEKPATARGRRKA